MIRASSERWSEKEAFLELARDPVLEVSYGAFFSGACRIARQLTDSGLNPHEPRILLTGANSPHWAAACLGAHMAGATVAPVDPDFPDRDLASVLEILEPDFVLCDRSSAGRFDKAGPKTIELETLEFPESPPSFEPVPLKPDQPLSIVFTSGTTSKPKGVMLTEENFLHNIRILKEGRDLISHRDRLLNLLPFHHVYPFTASLLTGLCSGVTIILPRSLKPEDIMRAAGDFRATIMIVVPQFLNGLHNRVFSTVADEPVHKRLGFNVLSRLGRLGNSRGLRPGRFIFRSLRRRLPALRYFACGGARLEPEVHRDLATLGLRIIEAYGLSETAPVVTLNDYRAPVPGSVGKPVPGVEVKVVRTDPAVTEGEILVRGPNVMTGYYHDPETTAEAFLDGWFRTGDLGRLDERGCLYLTGRLKEIIVMPSGKNIYPQALEEHYSCSELFEEVCICLIEDHTGAHLTAVVLPSRQALMRKKTARIYEEVKFHIENLAIKLPSYQRVTRVELVEQPFPKTRLGKLKRFEIIEALKKRIANSRVAGNQSDNGSEPADPLLSFTKRQLNLDRNPSGTDNLETDLGLDSLSKLEFISAVEEHFGISIPEEEAGALLCLDDLRPQIIAGGEKPAAALQRPGILEPPPTLERLVDTGNSPSGWAVRFLGHLALSLALKTLFRTCLSGLENLPAKGPFIIAPNHLSFIDGLVLFGKLPWRVSRRLFFVGTGDIFERFPFSRACYRGRIITTGQVGSTARSLDYCLEVLGNGWPLCLFPEGKRSIDKRADSPKPGVAILALEAGVPVVPVHLRGTGSLFSRLNPGFHLSRLELEILPSIEPEGGNEEILARWHEAMKERDHLV
ncbi:MAG: AMP-binding protein [Gemmatimonadota bacterium]|nr:AMP-binding protein [Gemmatimonadota bacterium]